MLDSAIRRVRLTAPRLAIPAVLLMGLAHGMGLMATDVTVRPRLSLSADAPDGMCELGQTVTFTAQVVNTSGDALHGKLRWELETLAFDAPVVEPVPIEVEGRGTASYDYKLEMEVPGFVRVSCFVSEDGEEREVKRQRRIGCEPTAIRSALTREPDFGEFWEESLKELGKVQPEYELKEIQRERGAGARRYELIMRSHGGVRVRGWLDVPPSEGPHAALLRVPGYSQNMRPVNNTRGMIVLSLNVRGHGNSVDDVPGQPADFWIRGLDLKETYYYRGAYLDCVRAVDYLTSREDVDPDRIAIWGGSQGGGLAFATAALDPRIDLCIADIPWLCDWIGYSRLVPKDDAMTNWLAAKEIRTESSVLQTLSYFDTMNLADRIRCTTIMAVGLQDSICPPSTSFATFNRITAPHDYRIYEDSGHGLGGDHYMWVVGEVQEIFGSGKH